jgi:hypothetical protein
MAQKSVARFSALLIVTPENRSSKTVLSAYSSLIQSTVLKTIQDMVVLYNTGRAD